MGATGISTAIQGNMGGFWINVANGHREAEAKSRKMR